MHKKITFGISFKIATYQSMALQLTHKNSIVKALQLFRNAALTALVNKFFYEPYKRLEL